MTERGESLEVHIANSQDFVECNDSRVTEIVKATLSAESITKASISVALVDNETIHELNRKYLQHDYATDVLSFSLDDDPSIIDGEIIVSGEMAVDQATTYDWRPIDELTLYIVHGLLHLCGYDDHSDTDVAAMRAREAVILRGLGAPHRGDGTSAEPTPG